MPDTLLGVCRVLNIQCGSCLFIQSGWTSSLAKEPLFRVSVQWSLAEWVSFSLYVEYESHSRINHSTKVQTDGQKATGRAALEPCCNCLQDGTTSWSSTHLNMPHFETLFSGRIRGENEAS